jgi:hypothetical protein
MRYPTWAADDPTIDLAAAARGELFVDRVGYLDVWHRWVVPVSGGMPGACGQSRYIGPARRSRLHRENRRWLVMSKMRAVPIVGVVRHVVAERVTGLGWFLAAGAGTRSG